MAELIKKLSPELRY